MVVKAVPRRQRKLRRWLSVNTPYKKKEGKAMKVSIESKLSRYSAPAFSFLETQRSRKPGISHRIPPLPQLQHNCRPKYIPNLLRSKQSTESLPSRSCYPSHHTKSPCPRFKSASISPRPSFSSVCISSAPCSWLKLPWRGKQSSNCEPKGDVRAPPKLVGDANGCEASGG